MQSDDIRNFFEHETPLDRSAAATPPPTPPRASLSFRGSSNVSGSSDGSGSAGGPAGRSATPPFVGVGARPIAYCQLGVRDYGQDPGIARVFEAAARFAADARDASARGGGNLLIHCRFGMNRSPTV